MRDHTASPKLPLSWGGFRAPTSIRTVPGKSWDQKVKFSMNWKGLESGLGRGKSW